MALHPDAQAAADAGIWNGLNPDDPVTREHAAIMVQRAKEQALRAIVQAPAGATGPQGERGPLGPQGLPGQAGADGAQGPAGDASAAALPDVFKVQVVGIGDV